jgi:hypothetical protein
VEVDAATAEIVAATATADIVVTTEVAPGTTGEAERCFLRARLLGWHRRLLLRNLLEEDKG